MKLPFITRKPPKDEVPKPPKMTNDELIELGKKLQNFYDSGYVNRKQALAFSFAKGIATGLGAFLGGTIVVALLLWSISLFDEAPFIGKILKATNNALTKQTSE